MSELPKCYRCSRESSEKLKDGDYWCSWCNQAFNPNGKQKESSKRKKKVAENPEGWTNALTSGLVSGVIFFFAKSKLDVPGSLIVPGLAVIFFITNDNFRFTHIQKAFAIVLMFAIGFFGQDILDWYISLGATGN